MDVPKLPSLTALKLTTGLNILLGAWFLWSPWEYGAASSLSAWNSWIVGASVTGLAVIRFMNPPGSRYLSLLNLILAAWIIASPWIYSYTSESSRFVNSVCVGVLILLLAGFGCADPGRG